MLKYIKMLGIGAISIMMSACDSSDYTSIANDSKLSGIVVDGYINNSTVCLDLNNNSACDSDEPTTESNEYGIFNFTNLALTKNTFIPIIAIGGVDTSTRKEFTGQLQSIVDTSILSENNIIILSPITDLMSISFKNPNKELNTTVDENQSLKLSYAYDSVASVLDIPSIDVDKDPMKDMAIFVKSQEIQHTKHIIQEVVEKNVDDKMTLSQELELQQKIKDSLLNLNMNIESILLSMDTHYEIAIPENEKNFIVKQINELKETLARLSSSESLDIENLNRLQKAIDTKQTEAIANLLEANATTVLKVVVIDTTTESITTSIFDKESAVLDEQACLVSNTYKVLSSSNSNKTNDDRNGISLLSKYEDNNSEVQIFYPTLENTTLTNHAGVYKDNYIFDFNLAWNHNTNRILYVMTPKESDGLFDCYKFELNFSADTESGGTKVFRYTEI